MMERGGLTQLPWAAASGGGENATRTGRYLIYSKGYQRSNTTVADLLGGHERAVMVIME